MSPRHLASETTSIIIKESHSAWQSNKSRCCL